MIIEAICLKKFEVVPFIGDILRLISILIYHEIIILYFFSLEEYTQTEIANRSKNEELSFEISSDENIY